MAGKELYETQQGVLVAVKEAKSIKPLHANLFVDLDLWIDSLIIPQSMR